MTDTPERPAVSLESHPDDERLAILRLDRPPVNALDQAMWDLLETAATALHESQTYRAVVITGGPRHFAAGADIKEMLPLTVAEFDQRNRHELSQFNALAQVTQPGQVRHA